MTIKSKNDMPALSKPTRSSYAWVLPEMMALTEQDYIEIEVPEGALLGTERNKLYNMLKLHCPVPPKGLLWKAAALNSESKQLLVIFLQRGEGGPLGNWAKGGKTPYDGSW